MGYQGFIIAQNEIHWAIHRGIFFTGTRIEEAVANDASLNVLIRVTNETHARFTASIGAQGLCRLFEGTTFSDPGAAIPTYNRHRNGSAILASTLLSYAPTLTDDGTELAGSFVPGGTRNQAEGFATSSFEEWILKAGEDYLLRLTNTSGSACDMSATVDFYEPGKAT